MRYPVSVVLIALLFACACGDDDAPAADASTSAADGAVVSVDGSLGEDLNMQAGDFECIKNGTKVGKYFVANNLGHLDAALSAANSPTGGTFPVGTILQLIPQEAMVKRAVGWNPTTNDWEFFALTVSGDTTTINTRGNEGVENQFGGNCFDCHSKAAPQWDLVCETTHGCDPLQLSDSVITFLQDGDGRCP